MKLGMLGCVTALAIFSTACSRNNIEAVNLANEGDKAKAMNIEEAISKYEQASKLDPTNHRILWKLALAEKQAPTFANYYFEHGYALEQQAKKGPTTWGEAKEPLTQAIQKDPNLGDAYHELAEVQLHLDDEQGALANYSKAIEVKPDDLGFYGPLADLYMRLGYVDQAEQVTKEGLAFAKEGDKHLFTLHSLLGAIKESRGDLNGAISEYEAAKKACGQCNEAGQQIAYFNLGAAYASVNPPRKNEAMQQLQSFNKIVCKGGAKVRYQDQCQQAEQFASKLNGSLQ